jgi:hypothetical protein
MVAALTASFAAAPAQAGRHGPRKPAPAITATQPDPGTAYIVPADNDDGRSRFLLADLPDRYEAPAQGVQLRWRLNKVKMKVPFSIAGM